MENILMNLSNKIWFCTVKTMQIYNQYYKMPYPSILRQPTKKQTNKQVQTQEVLSQVALLSILHG